MLYDAWLSKLLLKDAFRVNTPSKLIRSDLNIKNAFLDAKVTSDDINTIIKLQDLGFKCIDVEIQFKNEITEILDGFNFDQISYAKKEDEYLVRELASQSFIKSRFYKDPNIDNSIANKIKEEWAGNFFKGERGDSMVVSKDDRDLNGFLLTLRNNDDETIIDLLAVNKFKRRGGIAKSMLSFKFNELIQSNCTTKVGTQIDNINAINLYINMGFKIISTNFVFHMHL